MNIWRDYAEGKADHTIVGTLKMLEDVTSHQLRNRRTLYVYLPPSYAVSQRRYPVLYMHDGQNLFDAALSYAGEWQVDETMEKLSGEGIEAIVVGIPNTGFHRLDEYSPFRDQRLRKGGLGDKYVAFIANTVKTIIDRDFRTLPQREYTGILGSSMGGLISLYAHFRRSDVFGMAGVMSPSLWFAQEAILPYVQQAPAAPGKIYLDIGTHEGDEPPQTSHKYVNLYVNDARRMRDLLETKGYRLGQQLRYEEEEEGLHNEAAWARRLPDALRFLLAR